MLKIAMSEISRLFDAIQAVDELYLPVEKGNEVEFGPYSADAKVRLDALQTVKSAKDMFFPFQEDLMKFHMDGKKISVEAAAKKDKDFVVFGVRACDARSFSILDKVFLADPVLIIRQEESTALSYLWHVTDQRKLVFAVPLELMQLSQRVML